MTQEYLSDFQPHPVGVAVKRELDGGRVDGRHPGRSGGNRITALASGLLLGGVCLAAGNANALQIGKQLNFMEKVGDNAYQMKFTETVDNNEGADIEGLQLIYNVEDLPAGATVTLVTPPSVARQTNDQDGDGDIDLDDDDQPVITFEQLADAGNPDFNGDTEKTLLDPPLTLDGGADLDDNRKYFNRLFISYTLKVTVPAGNSGSYHFQSRSTQGDGDLSTNGSNPATSFNSNPDLKTTVYLPSVTGSTESTCLGIGTDFVELAENNKVVNDNFSTLHEAGSLATPVKNATLAGSFSSEAPYIGEDGVPVDHDIPVDGVTVEYDNSISIQSGMKYAVITGDSVLQSAFPGGQRKISNDTAQSEHEVDASNSWLYYVGNSADTPVRVWQQTVAGLKANTKYNFVAYVSNTVWSGMDALNVPPLVQLQAGEREDALNNVGDVSQLLIDTDGDHWRLVQGLVETGDAQESVVLAISDMNNSALDYTGTAWEGKSPGLGDALGITRIGLFECADSGAASLPADDNDQNNSNDETPVPDTTDSEASDNTSAATGGGGGAPGPGLLACVGMLLARRFRRITSRF